jgi:hypothetical protein
MGLLDDLRAKKAAAETAAKKAALSAEEREAKDLLDAIASADAERAASEAAKRQLDGEARLAAAREKHGEKYMLGVVDLVSMFPLDAPPPARYLPSNGGIGDAEVRGVVIVRDAADMEAQFVRAVEHKNAPDAVGLDKLLAQAFLKCVVDPPPDSPEAARVGEFAARFSAAATQAGASCRRLGGAKSKEKPRGVE